MRWLLVGPFAGVGAVAGVVAAFPDTGHRWLWVTVCGVGTGLAALIGLLPGRDHISKDPTLTGIKADTLRTSDSSTIIGQQHATKGGIAAGLLRQDILSTSLHSSRDVNITNLNVIQSSPTTDPEKLRHWTIPSPVSSFTGRQFELGQLRDGFAARNSVMLVPTVVLYGQVGVGKTQLVLAYASLWRSEYELGWWIPAESPLGILAALTELSIVLGLPQGLPSKLLTQRIQESLSDRKKWLLIFENAPDRASVEDFLPRAGGGHVLITSRNMSWRGVAVTMQIDVMSNEEAMTFLTVRTGDNDRRAAIAVADALGSLPLALEQASEYMNSFLPYHPQPLTQYLNLFQRRRNELLARGKPLAYEGTVDATFSLAVDKVAAVNIGAVYLLEVCAYLAPDKLPLHSLLDLPELLPEPLSTTARDPLTIEQTMNDLLRMGVLFPDENGTVRIHQLMQTVILGRQAESTRRDRLCQAVALVCALMPEETWEPRTWSRCLELLAHSEAVIEHAITADVITSPLAILLSRLGTFLWARGLGLDRALAVHQQASMAYKRLHQGDHPNIARSLYDLGADFRSLGDYEEARKLHMQAWQMWVRLYPEDHREVARSLNALAIDMSCLDDISTALVLHQQALEMLQRLYKGDHPDVATALNDLAINLRAMRQRDAARDLNKQALSMRQRLYGGQDHPEIAISLHNLADDISPPSIYYVKRMYQTIKYRTLALEMFRRVYQGDHPYIEIALSNLGMDFFRIGRYRKARKALQESLAMSQRIYQGDNLSVAWQLQRLAHVYGALWQPKKARDLYGRALEITIRIRQENDIRVAYIIQRLAWSYRWTGRFRRAYVLNRQALSIYSQACQDGDPFVLNNLQSSLLPMFFQGHFITVWRLQRMIDRASRSYRRDQEPSSDPKT